MKNNHDFLLSLKPIIVALLGSEDILKVVIYFIFAFIGATLTLLMEVRDRNKAKDQKDSVVPIKSKFDFIFMIQDNFRRMLTTFLLIFVFLRFLPELTGIELTHFTSFMIGLGSDKLSKLLKDTKRTFFNKYEEKGV